jgi:hypothetical protein
MYGISGDSRKRLTTAVPAEQIQKRYRSMERQSMSAAKM